MSLDALGMASSLKRLCGNKTWLMSFFPPAGNSKSFTVRLPKNHDELLFFVFKAMYFDELSIRYAHERANYAYGIVGPYIADHMVNLIMFASKTTSRCLPKLQNH